MIGERHNKSIPQKKSSGVPKYTTSGTRGGIAWEKKRLYFKGRKKRTITRVFFGGREKKTIHAIRRERRKQP